jgi:hypothetical protein
VKFALQLLACTIVHHGLISFDACCASVVVIANRTDSILAFEIIDDKDGKNESTKYRLLPNQSRPVPVTGMADLRVRHRIVETFELRPWGIYFFGQGPDGLSFTEIGISKPAAKRDKDSESDQAVTAVELPALATVQVRVFVDDELLSRRNPEQRVRERVRAASSILEDAAHVRFEVVSFDTWESIDHVSDFETLLIDFERKVSVEPGQLAIGFSTQASRSKQKMGATRLPLHSHVLVRERGQRFLSGPAQLELLVHELGHYLGAAHSPEWTSAMRPKLGDGLAGTSGFRIGLDPVNTMIVYLVGEQLRAGPIRGVWDLSPQVKSRLKLIYGDLAKALSSDPAAATYRKAMALTAAPPEEPPGITPMARHVRHVVAAVTSVAEMNVQRQDKYVAERFGGLFRLRGEALTEAYIRRAAEAARELPADVQTRAFAIGVAVAMDQSDLLRDNLMTRSVWRSSETGRENRFRRGVLDKPTMRGRDDLVQHFCISAGLAALFGTQFAEAAGVVKEHVDGKFSRADYSADLAGIKFFEHLEQSSDALDSLATGFQISDYVPLCEEVSSKDDESDRNHPAGQKVWREEILQEIEKLPAYVKSVQTKQGTDASATPEKTGDEESD